MALTPGLSANIRQPMQPEEDTPPGVEVVVEDAETAGDQPEYNDEGELLRIEHDDGSISISLDGKPIENGPEKKKGGPLLEAQSAPICRGSTTS